MSTRPTIEQVKQRFPEIAYAERMAREAGRADTDRYTRWYGIVKPILVQMMGSRDPGYDVAYQHLYSIYMEAGE